MNTHQYWLEGRMKAVQAEIVENIHIWQLLIRDEMEHPDTIERLEQLLTRLLSEWEVIADNEDLLLRVGRNVHSWLYTRLHVNHKTRMQDVEVHSPVYCYPVINPMTVIVIGNLADLLSFPTLDIAEAEFIQVGTADGLIEVAYNPVDNVLYFNHRGKK